MHRHTANTAFPLFSKPFRFTTWTLAVLLMGGIKPSMGASAEANNPFNEFMSPSGGVNVFSGDVALSHPLYSLEGVNGLSVDLGMNYSGNVHLNVRADNEKAPTEWVGLGWRMGFGNIHCDHGNTGVLIDDRCLYVSPKGVSQEILKKGDAYYLSKDPFWKVVPAKAADGMRILGWTLTNIDGRRFRYGDFAEAVTTAPNATRYVFWWKETTPKAVNYVGIGYSGVPKLYPWQWDLAEESDVDGNTIKYAYDQVRSKVKQGGWTSSIEYTQASYLASISIPGAGKAVFTTQEKSSDEIMDPHTLSPEPDAFMEFHETRYLESIRIQNDDGVDVRKFRFDYDVSNFHSERAKGFSKRFLIKVVETGADGTFVGTTRFFYSKEDPENTQKPLGVLTAMETPLCGKVGFSLERVSLGASRKIYPSATLGKFAFHAHAEGGRLKTGEEYLAVINGKGEEDKGNEIFIFNNEDGIWKEFLIKGMDPSNPVSRRLGLQNGKNVQVISGEGFFAVVKERSGEVFSVSVFWWDGKDWIAGEPLAHSKNLGSKPSVLAGKDMLVVSRFNQADMDSWSYHRQGDDWIEKEMPPVSGRTAVSLNGIHVLFSSPMEGNAAMTWNGESWIETLGGGGIGNAGSQKLLGNNFILQLNHNEGYIFWPSEIGPSFNVYGHSWTGRSWLGTSAYLLDSELFSFSNGDLPNMEGVGENYALVRSDDQDHLHLFEFTGERWRAALNRNMVNSDWDWFEANWHGDTWNDYALIRYPRIKWHWKWYYVVPYKELDSDAKLMAFHRVGGVWKERNFQAFGAPNTAKRVKLGQDFFVHNAFPHNAQIWDGTQWVESNWDRPFKPGAMESLAPTLMGEKADGEFTLFRKFQNSLVAPVYAYVVKKKTVTDPVRGQTAEFTYGYDLATARFDIRTSSAKFHQATIHLPDHGSRVTWFHNGHLDVGDPVSQNPESRELAGNSYREQDLSAAGKVVSERTQHFQIFRKADVWPRECRVIQISKVESEVRKVKTISEILYDDGNGLPARTDLTGSAGRKRITESLFAFQVPAYAALGASGNHMLSQVAETHVYEGTPINGNLMSSRVNTWAPDAKGAWHSVQSWVWNGKRNGSEPYAAFNHSLPASNPKPWKVEKTITLRDPSGRILQTTEPDGSSTCNVFGHGGLHRIGNVVNAPCAAIGILPGDYDDPGIGYLDETNGWAQNQAYLDLAEARFGGAALHVPVGGAGPSKRIGVPVPGRGYSFSAWVYPLAISPSSPIALVVRNASEEVLPAEALFGNLHPGSTHGWQRVERNLPASALGQGYVDISLEARGGAEFRVQDIRFLPKQSLASTRYLDTRLLLPLASVAASGSAEYFEYDGAGRMFKTYQEDEQGRKILRSAAEFHLEGCSAFQGASGALAKLTTSAGHIPFDKSVHDYGDLWLDPLLSRVYVEFAPENPDDEVQIRIAGGDWTSPCCRGNNNHEIPMIAATTVVEVRAGNGAPYKVTLRKPTTCWTGLGEAVSSGWAERPASQLDGSQKYAAYRNEQDAGKLYAKRWDANAQAWISMGGAISAGAVADITLKVSGGVPYLAYVDELPMLLPDGTSRLTTQAVVKKWNGSAWQPLQGDGVVSKGPVRALAFDVRGANLWVAYVGISGVLLPEGKSKSLSSIFARQWNGSAWVFIGGGGTPTGLVSDGNVSQVTLAIHPDGTPFVGYLGRVQLPGGSEGQPAGTLTSVFPIVKKRLGPVGNEYWGDLAPGSGGVYGTQGEVLGVPGTDKLQLSFGGADLYLALAYKPLVPIAGEPGNFESTENRILDVRKFNGSGLFTDKSHWFPLAAGATADEFAVAPLDPKGDFHFNAGGAAPSLVFTNAQNEDRISVIQFTGGKWQAIGNPAFLPSDAMAGTGRLSLSLGTGTDALVAVRQDDGALEASRNAVRAAQFSGSCPDLTLSQLKVYDGVQLVPLAWGFHPYILFQEGKIRAEAVSVGLNVAPAHLPGISKLWIIAADGSAQTWTAGTPLPDRFTVPLASGTNVIRIELLSLDGRQRIRYQVSLERLPPTAVTGTIILDRYVTVPGFDINVAGVYKVLVPADQTSLGFTVDIGRNADVFVDGRAIDNQQRVEVDLVPGTTIIKVVLVLKDGSRMEYEFQVDRGIPSLALLPTLAGVDFNPDGTYTARFSYENPNAAERVIPIGAVNRFRYQGRTGLDLGQPIRFPPGIATQAFTVVFDGSPLVWELDGRSVSAAAINAQSPILVEMKDNGLGEANISKPQLHLINRSATALSGFKVSLWLSRAEVPFQDIIADPYYFNPSGVTLAAASHPDNGNLVRIDLRFPSGFTLEPGMGTDINGIQLGVHFRNYYPGAWDRTNDWSWQGIGAEFRETAFVTVYGSNGQLLSGREPSPAAYPLPPALTQAAVFSLEQVWVWETTAGGLALSPSLKTEGQAGLRPDGSGYFKVSHLRMKTTAISGETGRMRVDFHLPPDQPNPYWMGSIQLFVDCPSAGLNSVYASQVDLTGLPQGAFSALEFNLPEAAVNALQEDHNDFQFQWVININQTSVKPVLDNMRFVP